MKNILIILLISLLLLACKKSVSDKESPVITNESLSAASVQAGGNIVVKATLIDNNELAAYKIVISDLFPFTIKENYNSTRLSLALSQDIFEETFALNQSITIPTNTATGEYKIVITIVDSKGNSATANTLYFSVVNPLTSPSITLLEPIDNNVYLANDTVKIEGTITDNEILDQLIVKSTNDSTWSNTQTIVLDTFNLNTWDLKTDGNLKIPLPGYSSAIKSQFYAVDTNGNYTINSVNYSVN